MFFKVRVKFLEAFKDGNILDGRLFKVGDIVDMDEIDAKKITQSGGYIEVLETFIPNPKKQVVEEAPVEAPKGAGKKKDANKT